MTRLEKILLMILRGTADANISFSDLRNLLLSLGFEERVRGSHHVFTRNGIVEIVNLQPHGAKAKPYQVKQIREIIVKYHLGGKDDDSI